MHAADSGLLRGVDRAAFATAITARLRGAGVPVGLTGTADLVRALEAGLPITRSELYWLARISLVRRPEEIPAFDAVFRAVFDDDDDPVTARRRGQDPPRRGDRNAKVPRVDAEPADGGGLPWATLPLVVDTAEGDGGTSVPIRLPAALDHLADRPFDELDAEELAALGEWLRHAIRRWPVRRTRKQRPDPGGRRIAIRATVARARRTGWEAVHLVRTRPVRQPRRVVMACDVSESMRAQLPAYRMVMHALADVAGAAAFSFATALHRGLGDPPDRFGGSRIATSLGTLVRDHGDVLRGAIVIIASDGWDSDPPAAMTEAMARLRRLAYRVVWLNPRAGSDGFRPSVAGMAAALPYCDEMLPADTFRSLREALNSIASHGSTAGTVPR